jgi:AraC-like DNA-binding protein
MTIGILNHSPLASLPEVISERCLELAALVTRHTDGKGNGFHQTGIDSHSERLRQRLEFQRESAAPVCLHGVSTPIFAILLQGKKQALLGEETYSYGASQYLVISVDLPISGFVVEATPDRPYLGFKLDLDLHQLCDIITTQTKPSARKQESSSSVRGLFVSTADITLLDCALRLTKLLDTPQDIPILAPLIIHEIYYRLLIGEQGEAVRQIATSGSKMQRIAEVIQVIKTDLTRSMRVEDLADRANMSASSFHHHFKTVTSMSPLQYQKQLRLLEARRLMLAENSTATIAAVGVASQNENRVGYESTSQFSREYSRMFGAPPMGDVKRLRTA